MIYLLLVLLGAGVCLIHLIKNSSLFSSSTSSSNPGKTKGWKSLPQPAGPPCLPLIGNLHQIPKTGAHRQFTEWAKTYGGIFSLKLGPSLTVVVTDRRLVREMLDRKSAVYSARPHSYVSHDLITRGDHLLTMQYGDLWRKFRRILHPFFMESAVDKSHLALVEAEQVAMVKDFLDRPGEHMVHTKRTSNSIIMSLVFGVRTPDATTPHMRDLYNVMERWSAVMETGATPPVDIFPFLKMVPESWFGNWVQRALDVGTSMRTLYSTQKGLVLARRAGNLKGHANSHANNGGAAAAERPTTLMDEVLDQQDKLQLTKHQQDFVGGVLMEGGSDTVSTMMLVVLQALCLNPDIVQRAQRDIDTVLDEDGTPRWEHRDKLPYITQIVKEAFRWRPVTPLGFPHALLSAEQGGQGDVVDGRFWLPPGTPVFLNVWGLHQDCKDPDRFDPDRYDGQTKTSAEYAASSEYELRDHYVFGAGRRICPGIHLAEREMFLGTAKLLWGFNIEQARDEMGNVIPIDTNPVTGYTEGFLVCPKDFACNITPRSERRAATIVREFEEARENVFSLYE
ncbi:cytochrome P450 [Trichoderma compactum]